MHSKASRVLFLLRNLSAVKSLVCEAQKEKKATKANRESKGFKVFKVNRESKARWEYLNRVIDLYKAKTEE